MRPAVVVPFILVALLAVAGAAHARPAARRALAASPAHAPTRPKVESDAPPEILLTFDDGPAIDKTPKVLDVLDQHGIKAVFFINGWHLQGHGAVAEKSRELLREELRRGHAIGNHTIHHYFLCGHYYIKQAYQEIEGNAALIEEAIGQRPDLFRTPYGAHCKQLSETLASFGIKPTGWDIDPQDWRLKNAAKIEAYVERALTKLHGRAIVLFHDVQAATVVALPRILDWIDQENARRVAASKAPIKIINYAYLLPQRRLVPPFLDVLGRVLVGMANRVVAAPLPLWPGGGLQLAWPAGQV